MMINDLVAALEKVPPMMAAGWIAWLITGAMLSRWSQYERNRVPVQARSSKPKSGVRAPRQPTSIPFTTGDAFGELEAILDDKSAGMHRRPGDDVESPVLTNSAGAPSLAAPQSLP